MLRLPLGARAPSQRANRCPAPTRARPLVVLLPKSEREPAPPGHRLLGSRDRRPLHRSARRHRQESRGALQAEACPGPGSQTSRGEHHPEQSAGRQERPLGVSRAPNPPLPGEPEPCPAHNPGHQKCFCDPLLSPGDVSLPAPSSQIPSYCITLTCYDHLPG